jgi:5-(carboxyamino)imidazole ribonucleotide mutase
MGSASDKDKMRPAVETLERFGVEADERVLSAHRTPAKVVELASTAREAGYAAFTELASRPPRWRCRRPHHVAGGRCADLGAA